MVFGKGDGEGEEVRAKLDGGGRAKGERGGLEGDVVEVDKTG